MPYILQSLARVSFVFAFGLILLFSPLRLSAETIVIAHPDVEQDVISSQALSRIYAMQVRRWPASTTINVYRLSSNNPIHQSFVITELKMQPHQLDRLWGRYIFSGTGATPSILKDEQEMISTVRTTPGAIGYVSRATNVTGVKVLEVTH